MLNRRFFQTLWRPRSISGGIGRAVVVAIVLFAGFSAVTASPEFLRPEEAFTVEARLDGQTIVVDWSIKDGYYLYKKRFGVTSSTEHVALGSPDIPTGQIREDKFFGKSEVYRDAVPIRVPVSVSQPVTEIALTVASQGCADAGLCYPPDKRQLTLAVPDGALEVTADASAAPGQDQGVARIQNLLGFDKSMPSTQMDLIDEPASNRMSMSPVESAGQQDDALSAIGELGKSLGLGDGAEQFLDPEVAFQLETRLGDGELIARWDIVDAYYLYRHKFAFEVLDGGQELLGAANLKPGKAYHDNYFGDVEVYYKEAVARVPLHARPPGSELKVRVTYQGCADAGLCYPPIKKTFTHVVPASFAFSDRSPEQDSDRNDGSTLLASGGGSAGGTGGNLTGSGSTGASSGGNISGAARIGEAGGGLAPMVSEQDRLTRLLAGGSLWLIIAAFFGGGLLLSLTPCVFPMIPILSSIIVGQGEQLSRKRAFALSFVYVQGMALTYTAVGIIAGMTGANLQIFFQDPLVLTTFALVFVALAFSMFGFYELQLPASWQSKLTDVSNQQKGGSVKGVATMGVLSALIVGPCVAPPLFGALAYISTTGDGVLGGVALYALSMGMGVPLLAVGVSAGALMPRAGGWMETVKKVFGVLLLGVAVYFLERILPGWVSMLLWAALLIVSAIYMGALDQIAEAASGWRRLWKGTGLVMMTYGVLLMVGATAGNTDPTLPLKGIGLGGSLVAGNTEAKMEYRWIKGVEGLDGALKQAKAEGRPVMLDYYADWCISCKEMDKFTFSDPAVIAALSNVIVLKTDVTKDDAADKALMKRFGLYGPPTIQFFGPDGVERKGYRVVGFMNATKFKAHLDRMFGAVRLAGG